VAVITNGTAVLGLGDIGPLAAKPVMEGKGVLFKKFAGIDVFDIEINEKDPDKLVDIIAAWSRPSAASTSKTSRRRTASTSSASCASA
jgi:malic enzyme